MESNPDRTPFCLPATTREAENKVMSGDPTATGTWLAFSDVRAEHSLVTKNVCAPGAL